MEGRKKEREGEEGGRRKTENKEEREKVGWLGCVREGKKGRRRL